MKDWMRRNLNLNTIVSGAAVGLLIFVVTRIDENYQVLMRVKTNQESVMQRLDKYEMRMEQMQVEIARVAAEVEMLKDKRPNAKGTN